MNGAAGWIKRRFWGLVVGAGVTVLVAIAYLFGLLTWLDYAFLDFNFRRVNRVEADPRIVMIDINDWALKRVGHWPWPRRLQARLIEVLHECGADAILLDLIYSEPTLPRIEHPQLDPDFAIDPGAGVLGEVTLADAIRDDQELANAIARAGNVYAGMYFRVSDPDVDWHDRRARARAMLDADPDTDLRTFSNQLGLHDSEEAGRFHEQMRIDRILRADFGATVPEIAQQLDIPPDQVERRISDAKDAAARYLVQRHLTDNPDATFPDVYATILPDKPADRESRDRLDLRVAYRHALSAQQVFAQSLHNADRFRGLIPNGIDETLPIPAIAQAARRAGFVTFRTDSDGVLRRVPPLANVEGHPILQLGFGLACDVLDIDPEAIIIEGSRTLSMADRSASRQWRLPLDERGAVLLNWHIDRAAPTWEKSFVHIPVTRLMEVASNRNDIEDNQARLRLRIGEAIELMHGEAKSAYLDYERDARRLRQLADDPDADPAERAELAARIEQTERNARAFIEHTFKETHGLEPEDDYERNLFPRVRSLHADLVTGEFAARIERDNAAIAARTERLLAELREQIAGKLCFVGHTAAAQADMVNSPAFEDMPGVMAHSNMVNMMLTGRIPTLAPKWVNVLAILLTGLVVTMLTSSSGPWPSFITTALLMPLVIGASSLLMYLGWGYVAGVIPAAACFIAWALITLYRQLTEQRHRRSFARALARNTSPAIAARITDQLDDLDLSPVQADVTCYFSDLQGFTTISERLSADQTKTILNRYLGEMGEVLVGLKAFNKFMGDGIFAFFNAPIWTVEDHARTGCEAALQTLERLRWLQESADGEYKQEYANLRMRVGVHTGPVFVGYFGSENQTDYTCIGDTVNLAARLEPANKVFGTRIIVSGPCRDAVGDQFAFRHLGALQVKGKSLAVPVYELLGRSTEVDDDARRYAELFAAAVAKFQRRDWIGARTELEHCTRLRPDDEAIGVYSAEIERLQVSPPPDDWNQAIELTTK